MGARQKLNQIHLVGSAVVAAILGWLTGSWMVFFIVLVILLVLCCFTGDIRPRQNQR